MKKIEKIILLIALIIIITGIVILGIFKVNKGFDYAQSKRIEIYIPKGYNSEDILNIAKESFSTKYIEVVEIEKLNQIAGIKLKEYTEEELSNYKEKIMAKYEIAEEEFQIYEIDVPETRLSTVISPYVLPVTIITIVSFAYFIIRNIKQNDLLTIILKTISILIIIAGVFFSIIVIARIPFSRITMPIAMLVYMLTLLLIINKK